MAKKEGIIQYFCPETTAMGLMRNPQGRQQHDSFFPVTIARISSMKPLALEAFRELPFTPGGHRHFSPVRATLFLCAIFHWGNEDRKWKTFFVVHTLKKR